ncbi:MAG TPA: Rnase Y domain-containing protein, partial [Phycisphaerae bacterium]|nr:Rnase Y domain-containing protein [Phycisphaerae bacterium]
MGLLGWLAVSSSSTIALVIVALLVGAGIAYGISIGWAKSRSRIARGRAEQLLNEAREKAESIVERAHIEAKEEALRLREEIEQEVAGTRAELKEAERRLAKREDNLEKKLDALNTQERSLQAQERQLQDRDKALTLKEKELAEIVSQQRDQLLKISGMSQEEARELLLSRLKHDVERESAAIVENAITAAKETAEEKSREIILTAIQRYAAEHTSDHTVSAVDIPSDDMKGRVIGREGRNIRAFEKATGVDVIVDDTPGVVVVSAFDPIRREVARISLERLIQDGRIHPARI